MRTRNKWLFRLAVAATMGMIFHFYYPRVESLARLIGIIRCLSPASAQANNTDSIDAKPSNPGVISAKTRAVVAKLTPGMSRGQVEKILGQCAFGKTERGPDGRAIESAAWMHGDDMICIRFREAAVMVVAAAPLADLAEPTTPTPAEPAGKSAVAESGKGPSPGPEDFQNRLRQLEKDNVAYLSHIWIDG